MLVLRKETADATMQVQVVVTHGSQMCVGPSIKLTMNGPKTWDRSP